MNFSNFFHMEAKTHSQKSPMHNKEKSTIKLDMDQDLKPGLRLKKFQLWITVNNIKHQSCNWDLRKNDI